MKNLNTALRLVRIFHDTKQIELAKNLKISNSFLSEIESGKKSVTIDLLEKYSKFFDIPTSSIILFSEKIESSTFSENTRVFVSKKIIKLMEWLVIKGRHDGKKFT